MSEASDPSETLCAVEAAIELDGLTKRFGARTVVDGLSLSVPVGGVTGFLGPNGSGKSTTIRMLLGLVRPTSGSAQVLGRPITRPSAYVADVGALIDSPALYPMLSARENLAVHARLAGLADQRVAEVLDIVGLSGRERDVVRSYSLGMKQRLAIAIALLRSPRLLVLDEPTNGLDPAGIVEIRNLIIQLGKAGHTVVVSSHVLAEMQAACDRFVVIRDGKLLFAGTSEELLSTKKRAVKVRAENPRDLARLADRYQERWHVDRNGETLIVDAADGDAAELNRVAFESGIVLRELFSGHEDLEEVFLDLVGGGTA